jgi:hypothetical protein
MRQRPLSNLDVRDRSLMSMINQKEYLVKPHTGDDKGAHFDRCFYDNLSPFLVAVGEEAEGPVNEWLKIPMSS